MPLCNEILANQHYNLAKKYSVEINLELFTGKTNTSNKEKLYQIYKILKLILFLTHSLFQKTIFNKLGFIIIDEQHKFGVKQRKYYLIKEVLIVIYF